MFPFVSGLMMVYETPNIHRIYTCSKIEYQDSASSGTNVIPRFYEIRIETSISDIASIRWDKTGNRKPLLYMSFMSSWDV